MVPHGGGRESSRGAVRKTVSYFWLVLLVASEAFFVVEAFFIERLA